MLDYSDPQRQIATMMGIPINNGSGLSVLNHSYSYAKSNPINFIDPTGEMFRGIPTNAEEAKELYPGTKPLTECQRCKIRTQVLLCPAISWGMGKKGAAAGGAIGSAFPGLGTGAGATAGALSGAVVGMGVCGEIKEEVCSSVCDDDDNCEK